MTPREDTTSTTEPEAAATFAAIGYDEHTFGLRGVPGSRLLIVVCSCGWESEPEHLSNTRLARQDHLKAVAGDA